MGSASGGGKSTKSETDDFETFWRAYPRRIAKGYARRAFAKAIKKTSLEAILAGIEAYKQNKPDWQDYAHPSTWLNGERWDDEYEKKQRW